MGSFFDNDMDLIDNEFEENKENNKTKSNLRQIKPPQIRFKNKNENIVTKKIPKIQISTTMKNDVSPKTKYLNNFKNSSNSDKKSTLKLMKSPKSPKSTKKLSKLELMILERQEKIEKESIKIKEKRMKRISLTLNKSNKNHTTFYKHTNNSKQKKILLTPNLEKELVKRNNDIQRDINLQPKHLKNSKNKEIKKKNQQ